MRGVHCAFAVCLMSWSVAQANDQQDLKEYRNALKTFGAGQPTIGGYLTVAPKQVLDGVEGRWGLLYQIGLADPTSEDVAKLCKAAEWTISAKDSFGFSMTHEGGGKSYSISYINAGGNGFVFTTDIAGKLNYMGIDASNNVSDAQAMTRMSSIRSASGLAMVYRPSVNTLVIQSFASAPNIYIRCP